jgi:hypothetical protein
MVRTATGLELTAADHLKDFLRIYGAKYQPKELDEDVRLWLEILELVVLISYRHLPFPLSTTVTSESAQRQLAERRNYWLSARRGKVNSADQEHGIYTAYDGFCTKLKPPGQNKPAYPKLRDFSPLFFTISAKVASCIGQGISEQWMELAAQFMLQAALESCLMPGGATNGENPLAVSFAWGWIPPRFWDDVGSSDESGVEAEMLINSMFVDDNKNSPRENRIWQKIRLRYMSLFRIPQPEGHLDRHVLSTHLMNIAKHHPLQDFEKKVVAFSKSIWEICRTPLLTQIEGGAVEGMTKSEFEDFKKRAFLPL